MRFSKREVSKTEVQTQLSRILLRCKGKLIIIWIRTFKVTQWQRYHFLENTCIRRISEMTKRSTQITNGTKLLILKELTNWKRNINGWSSTERGRVDWQFSCSSITNSFTEEKELKFFVITGWWIYTNAHCYWY